MSKKVNGSKKTTTPKDEFINEFSGDETSKNNVEFIPNSKQKESRTIIILKSTESFEEDSKRCEEEFGVNLKEKLLSFGGTTVNEISKQETHIFSTTGRIEVLQFLKEFFPEKIETLIKRDEIVIEVEEEEKIAV